MTAKEFNIEIPKQDYQIVQLSIMENGQAVKLNKNDEIFMTVKRFASNKEHVLQKTLKNGITYNENTKKYEIEINSEDTKDMEGTYGYDITVFYDGNKPKQKLIGQFIVGDKYTLNEVI